MVKYGRNEKIGLSIIVLIVFVGVFLFVPITTESIDVQCITAPCPPIVESKTLFEILSTPEPRQPIACTLEFAPVCGIDGVTYGNACMAGANEVEIAHAGECTEDEGIVMVQEPSTFCKIYPTGLGC